MLRHKTGRTEARLQLKECAKIVKMAGMSILKNKLEAYVCSANKALEFKLVRSEKDLYNDSVTFKPEFTHQVFGDNESILGFKDLCIKLYYSASWLTTYLGMTYSEKMDPNRFDGVKADDVLNQIAEKLQPNFHTSLDDFVNSLDKDANFEPFGELLHSFSVTSPETGESKQYVIHHADTSTPGFINYHERLQTFVLWFIDAASFIDVDDDKWHFYLIFEKYHVNGDPHYAIVGYTTVYHYYAYPNRIRPKISQMMIFPQFQKQGLGAELLQTIYQTYIKDSNVLDITVEDPSDNFTRLRDFVDAKNCLKLPSFQPQNLSKGFNDSMAQEAQTKLKINKRQARRIYEILRLHITSLNDDKQYKQYRIDVKRRLNLPYQKQQSDLMKLQKTLRPEELRATMHCNNREQRLEQLERQYQELEAEYRHILERLAEEKLD